MPKSTPSTRLRALLATGYFPEELPPPFTTESFARFRRSIGVAWSALPAHYPKSVPDLYSGPRHHGWRRDFALVNPVAQYHVAKLIADNWVDIVKHTGNTYSAEALRISEDGARAVPKPDFELVRLRHLEITAQFDYVLVADISRFYGTLYTHAIPWALHTKAWCKTYLNTPAFRATLGDKLDLAVRRGNDNQTLGVAVGPDTSRILSEIVIAAVDEVLRAKLGLSRDRAVRHVDDWYIGFDTLGEAEAARAVLSAACRDFQLEIHPEKTRCVHVEMEGASPWPAALRSINIASGGAAQRRSLEHFFSEAFRFAREYPSENVSLFAVSRSRQFAVKPENWHIYETYLLKAARANATTLPAIVQIFASYRRSGFTLGTTRIGKLIEDVVRSCAPMAFHAEVAWALFLAKVLAIQLPAASLAPVSELDSAVCALLALDLQSRGLIDGALDVSLWQQSMNTAGLGSNMWLLAYEADLKGWLTPSAPFVEADPYFRELKSRSISFYNIKKNVKDIKMVKPKLSSSSLVELLAKWQAAQPQGPAAVAEAFIAGASDGLGGYWDAG